MKNEELVCVYLVMWIDEGHHIVDSVWGTKTKAEAELKRLEAAGGCGYIMREEVK